MLTLLAVLFGLACAAFGLCWFFLGWSGREALKREIASLREKLSGAEARYAESRRITGELLEVVKGQVGLTQPVASKGEPPFDFERVKSNYIPPEVKNCPECSVSVRSDSWPQECPACHSVFGFLEG